MEEGFAVSVRAHFPKENKKYRPGQIRASNLPLLLSKDDLI